MEYQNIRRGRGLNIYQMLGNCNINRNGEMPIVHYLYLRLNFKWLGTLFLRGQHSNQGRVLWTVVYLPKKNKNRKRQLSSH